MNNKPDVDFFDRLKFDIKKDFTGSPVIFMVIDDDIGNRISFYPGSDDETTIEIFNKILKDQKDVLNVTMKHLVEKTQWGVEIFADDNCIQLILHDENNKQGKFRCCNEDMFFYFIDFME